MPTPQTPAAAPTGLVIPDLAGKAVLVTGASTGIGAALAIAYAEQKCRVALHYNASREAAENLAATIRGRGGEVFLVQGDFSVTADVERVVEDSARAFGRLDGLVNNAGGMLGRVPYSEQTEAHYDAVMDLNARSVLTATRKAIPWLKKQGGFIVNTSSIAARNGAGGGAGLYGSAKAFVSNVTRAEGEFALLRQTGTHSFAWLAADLNPNGVVGDAAAATAEKGRLTAEHQADGFITLLRDIRKATLADWIL